MPGKNPEPEKIYRKLLIRAFVPLLGIFLSIPLVACGGVEPATTSNGVPATATGASQQATTSTDPTGSHTVAIDGHTLTLPDGFTISRWVTGRDGLRMMAVTDDGYLLVTEMGKGNVLGFRLTDENPEAITVISGLKRPSGIAFHDGSVWVAEETKVSRYPYNAGGSVGDGETVISGLPSGGHGTRTIGFGPDGKLYLAIGSSCNVCEEEDDRRAAILRFNADGSGQELFSSGLRNTVGFTWNPATGEMWGVDNGRDGLGDDLPPDEVNIIMQGKVYGWPWCYGSFQVNPEFADDQQRARFCEATEPPVVEMQAHSAPLGLRFLSESAWPTAWKGDLFIAFHGSWNRSDPTGYKVVRVDRSRQVIDFVTGWLDERTGSAWGRPVDIMFANNKMYISDDASGSIYIVQPADQ
ncbi:MAG: PQQ-dependent sugar dehydrogenase [Thermoleophilia bacterium]|nr:PQQ-dependent sugar dehydrogenase [Thermoleophilia bacterium]